MARSRLVLLQIVVLVLAVLVAGCRPGPVADPGPLQETRTGELVVLDGSASSSPGGAPLGYAWEIVTTPVGSAAALDDPSSATPSFVPDLPGDHAVALVVSTATANSLARSVIVRAFSFETLAFEPVDVEFSASLDRLVAVRMTRRRT